MHRGLYVLFLLQVFFGIGQAMFLTEYPVVAFGLIDTRAMTARRTTCAKRHSVPSRPRTGPGSTSGS